ncbi:MAG: ATP-dependent helicase HrpB [Verrucomicrobia bacterium]|nr:MAG: ATP-dependent helicase HrpB [Verrucomicrobiota bacterium]
MAERLPIYELEEALVRGWRAGEHLIVCAPTGSGKSTQIPQILLRRGLLETEGRPGQLIILQPRRLAARLLAARVAQELGVRLGAEVGYSIRFENVAGRETRIRFVTEGVLLRQMLEDPELPGVAGLIFDEFHERHLYGDITLAKAIELQETRRPDLRLAVMSATLDVELLRRYLAGAGRPVTVLSSEGRLHPVEIRYEAVPSYAQRRPVWERAADAFEAWAAAGGAGDVLIFMPGAYEIQQTLAALGERPAARGRVLLPLHGELPAAAQDAAVARHDRPKIVVATNVAETSITIDGIRLVIDSGLARIARFDPWRGINTLLVEKISQASADQRAGRAGRTAPGVCHRLWSEEEHAQRPAREEPEVRRLDLAEVVLTLKAAGVRDLRSFRWLEPPDERRLAHAEELLLDLGALRTLPGTEAAASDAPPATEITELGRRMLKFPLHPRYARMLLAAAERGCVRQACLAAALTQGRDLLRRRADKTARDRREDLFGDKADSDFFHLMRAWSYAARENFREGACRRVGINAAAARQVAPLFGQFLRIAEKEGLPIEERPASDEAIRQCLLIGFCDRLARRLDSGTLRCEMVHGRRGELARESVVQHHPLFVAAEVREIGRHDGEVRTLLSLATAVEAAWLEALFPDEIRTERHVTYDPGTKRVYAEERRSFRGLALARQRVEPPPADEAARLLAAEVLAGRLTLKHWNHEVEQWIARLNCLAQWCPELELPPITPEARAALVEQICHGACSYKEIKDRPVKPVVRDWLNAAQREWLDRHAPERVRLANGRRPRVIYSETEPPHVALRIQELFGVNETPRIAMGRVPVVVHILAPNMRPVQVTTDLARFWREHYPRVKSELQRRYPKHAWP